MKYEVTVIAKGTSETYEVEAPRRGLAQTHAIGEALTNHGLRLHGDPVSYVVYAEIDGVKTRVLYQWEIDRGIVDPSELHIVEG